MKSVPNINYTIRLLPDRTGSTAAELLAACLQHPPPGGFDFSLMRARNRVADAAEKAAAGGEINLEDADFPAAVDAVRGMRWGISHKDIIAFSELFGL